MKSPPLKTTPTRAFTVIELLIVVAIMAILLGITVPVLRTMSRGSKIQSALNVVSAASQAARGYATQSKADLNTVIPNADHSGVAMLFTPANEIRLVENDQTAINQTGAFIESGSGANKRNAYRDIDDRDYILLPRGSGVVGIARFSTGDIELLTPPFGVRFNEKGQLASSNYPTSFLDDAARNLIYYDADYDGEADNSRDRSNPFYVSGSAYNPDDWDPDSPTYSDNDDTSVNPGFHPDQDRYKLPFEEIESVMGVFVYNKFEFRDADLNLETTTSGGNQILNAAAAAWIKENGTPVFFNQYTGTMLRTERPD